MTIPRTDEESSLQTAISDSQQLSQKVEQVQFEQEDQPEVDLANPQVMTDPPCSSPSCLGISIPALGLIENFFLTNELFVSLFFL